MIELFGKEGRYERSALTIELQARTIAAEVELETSTSRHQKTPPFAPPIDGTFIERPAGTGNAPSPLTPLSLESPAGTERTLGGGQ